MKNTAAIRSILAACAVGATLCVADVSSKELEAAGSQTCGPIDATTVNVRDFGAKGDGRTDDTAALRNAMARLGSVLSCGSSHYGKLFFPPGTYIVGGVLSLSQSSDSWRGVSIEGDSVDAAVIETAQNSGIFGIRLTKQVPVTVRDLTLAADNSHAGAAVSISAPAESRPGGPRSLVMQDVTITGNETGMGYFDYGLKGFGLTNPLLDGLRIVGPQMQDAGSQDTYGDACVSLVGGWGVEIVNPSSCNRMTVGLDLKQLGGLASVHARNFGVKANYGIKINAGGGRVVIEGTHVHAAMGIVITKASAATLSGNLLLGLDGAGAPEHGGISVDNSSNVSVIDNVLWHGAMATNPNSADIFVGSGDQNVVVARNTINGLGTGIAIASGVSDSRILYNRIYGQTSGISDNGSRTVVRLLEPGSGTRQQ
jgi:hypothetical protein